MRWIALLLAGHLALGGTPLGWRQDGSAVLTGDRAPTGWDDPTWSTPLATWGNASPLLVDGRLYVTLEPTNLVCLDARTGAIRWQASSDHVYTVPLAERDRALAEAATATTAADRLVAARTEHSRRLRALRSGGADPAAVERSRAEVHALEAEVERLSHHLTPPDSERIGYASPTPASDGSAVHALFGNGVVSRFEADGTRAWSVWLGPPPPSMRGHDQGTSATPIAAEGLLVVPYGRQRALDGATGAIVWEGPEYLDYGSPVLGRLGGVPVVITPAGQVVRLRDGLLLASGLGDLWFVGPSITGDRVFFAGGTHDQVLAGALTAAAWDLAGRAPRLRWRVPLPLTERLYGPPVAHEGSLHLISSGGRHLVLDLDDGTLLHDGWLDAPGGLAVFANPTVVGDELLVAFESGDVARVAASAPWTVHGWERTAPHRSTPLFAPGAVYVRTDEGVIGVLAP